MTFDHRAADGVAAVRVIGDLISSLNGRHLSAQPVPGAQEDLLDQAPVPTQPANAGPEPGAPDPRLTAMGELRPFDGTRPEVTSADMSTAQTRDLINACHEHSTTVHAALCAAATRVLQRSGRGYVRIVTPWTCGAPSVLLTTSRSGSCRPAPGPPPTSRMTCGNSPGPPRHSWPTPCRWRPGNGDPAPRRSCTPTAATSLGSRGRCNIVYFD